MKILILGIDGYIGYPLAINLLKQGHEVIGLDNFSRRDRAPHSLTNIASVNARRNYLGSLENFLGLGNIHLGYTNPCHLRDMLNEIVPDAIIHLAEQPSASWSMVDPFNCVDTQMGNVIGTLHLLWCIKEECPETHLIKLGTMGEYGTPNCDIPEGRVDHQCIAGIRDHHNEVAECPMSGLMFPRTPGSFYHASKVMDTINIEFACRNWGLTSTDIMQGVVFGLASIDPNEITRFDYDEHFGTCINRFVSQVISGYPLTIYGSGGQTRGWLPLNDSIECINLILNNPPEKGSYRTINQFAQIYSINSIANIVCQAAMLSGLKPEIEKIPNPRNESENHYYCPSHDTLLSLNYLPNNSFIAEIQKLIYQLSPYKDSVKQELILPRTTWR